MQAAPPPAGPVDPSRASLLRRDRARLRETSFDLAVVGAGIYGAWVALDAACRGLRVVVLDQADFGHATSANSQRIVHGGLRYLQHANLKRFRESVRERSTLLRLAPQLVRPMQVLVPAEGFGLKSRMVLGLGVKLNDLLSATRNRDLPSGQRLPDCRSLSREECLKIFPGFDQQRLSGGVLFHDAQVHNSERLCLSILHSAAGEGALPVNYVRATGLVREGDRVVGVEAEDRRTGERCTVKAGMVIGCCGPWTAYGPAGMNGDRGKERFPVFRAVVLVTRPFLGQAAVALAGRQGYKDEAELFSKGYRNYFVTPWRDRALVGTFYTEWTGDPDHVTVTRSEIEGFLGEFREICPSVKLGPEDVKHVFAGLLPREPSSRTASIQYAKSYRIVDHEQEGGLKGLISVVGVKWTTARQVAEETVDLALVRSGRKPVASRTATLPLHGGDCGAVEAYVEAQSALRPAELSRESFENLIRNHGTAYHDVLAWCRDDPQLLRPIVDGQPEILAEIVHGVRAEMALNLDDVIFRRTALGTAGRPARECVERCASWMARELGWTEEQRVTQIEGVDATYERLGIGDAGD